MNKDNLRKISVILLAGLIVLGGWHMLATGAKSKDLDPNAIYLSDTKLVHQQVGYDRYRKDQPLIERPDDYQQITINHPISLKPQSYSKGVFAHADAELIYDLSVPNAENKTLFQAFAGVQANRDKGRLKFDFYLDGALVATTESIGRFQTKPVILDIKNRRRLKIKIDHLGDKTQDHAVLADAKFITGDLKGMINQTELENRVNSQFNLATAPHDQTSRLVMLQAQLLRRIGLMDYQYFIKNGDNQAFIDWLLNDIDALSMSNEAENPYGTGLGFLTILKALIDYDSTIQTDSLNKKIAIATATAFSGKVRFWADWAQEVDHISRYRMFRNLSRVEGQLRPIFYEIDTAYMTTVIKAEATDEDILWLREKIKNEKPELLVSNQKISDTTFHYIRYNEFNRFGDSIHLPNFYGFHPSLAEIIEHGGVCGTVSKFDSVALNAFGVPGILVGQPGHAAVIYMTDQLDWSGTNWVSSWGDTTANPYSATIRDANHETTFSHVAAASLKHPNYDQARELYDYAKYLTDYRTKRATLARVIELNPLFLPAYQSMLELYQATNVSGEYQYLELAHQMMANLYNYPVPLTERLKPIKAKITSRHGLNEFYAKYLEAINKIDSDVGRDSLRPERHQAKVKEAQDFLGKFSFSGDQANRIVGSQVDTEYSLDDGRSWKPIKEADHQLTSEEIASIRPQSGIKLKVRGSRYAIPITFKQAPRPNLRVNDQENFIIGISMSMEYSYDNGQTWLDYANIRPELSGNVQVLVRVKSVDTTYASEAVQLTFHDNQLDENFNFILKQNLKIKRVTSEVPDKNEGAENLIDGDINTLWHSNYNRVDTQPSIIIELDQYYPVTGLQYVPRQTGPAGKENGRAEQVNISYYDQNIDTNNPQEIDKIAFVPINSQPIVMNYQGDTKQAVNINFSQPVNAKYIKLQITKGYNHYASAGEIRIRTTKAKALDAFRKFNKRNASRNFGRLYDSLVSRLLPKYRALQTAMSHASDKARLGEMISWIENIDNNLSGGDNDTKFKRLNLKTQQFEKIYSQLSDQHAKHRAANLHPEIPAVVSFSSENQELASEFRRDFQQELAIIEHDYHRLARAYYNLISLPNEVVSQLTSEKTNLLSKLKRLSQDQASAQLYRQQFAELLSSDDIAVSNRQLNQAKQSLKLLSGEARNLLSAEQSQLRSLEARSKADSANSRLILTKMTADGKDFVDRLEDAEYRQAQDLIQTVKTAEAVLAKGGRRTQYDQLSYDLMMQMNRLKFQIKNQVLIEKRVQDFYRKAQAAGNILGKDLLSINKQDASAYDQMQRMYTRLGQAAQQMTEDDARHLTLVKKIIDNEVNPDLLRSVLGQLIDNAQIIKNKLHYQSLIQELQKAIPQADNLNALADEIVAAQLQTLQKQLVAIKDRDSQARQWEAQVRYQHQSLFRRAPDDVPISQKNQVQNLLTEVRNKAKELNVDLASVERPLEAIRVSIDRRLAVTQPEPPVNNPPAPSQPKPQPQPVPPTTGQSGNHNDTSSKPPVDKQPESSVPNNTDTNKSETPKNNPQANDQTSSKQDSTTPPVTDKVADNSNKPVDQPKNNQSNPTESTIAPSVKDQPKENSELKGDTSSATPLDTEGKDQTMAKPNKKSDSESINHNATIAPNQAAPYGQSDAKSSAASTNPAASHSSTSTVKKPAPVMKPSESVTIQQTQPTIKQQVSGSIRSSSDRQPIVPLGEVYRHPDNINQSPVQKPQSGEHSAQPKVGAPVSQLSTKEPSQDKPIDKQSTLSRLVLLAIIGLMVSGVGWWAIVARRRQ